MPPHPRAHGSHYSSTARTVAILGLFFSIIMKSLVFSLPTSKFMTRIHTMRRRRNLCRRSSSPLDDFLTDHVLQPAFLESQTDMKDTILKEDNENSYSKLNKKQTHTGWKRIDWNALKIEETEIKPSPVELTMVRDRMVHIKRDDLLKLSGSQISGNKARKLWSAHHLQDFPKGIVSYGGPQSNAMLAMAALVHYQNQKEPTYHGENSRKFVYYTKKLPKFLRSSPSGNFFRAQSLGMELVEVPAQQYQAFFGDEATRNEPPAFLDPPFPEDSLWIPQGGASDIAMAGCRRLAKEIVDYWEEQGRQRPLSVCIPGGTCTTAALVHVALQSHVNHTSMDIQVLVIPCVGDATYAKRQMEALYQQLDISADIALPKILPPFPASSQVQRLGTNAATSVDGYYVFGEPHVDILDTYREFKDRHQIQLDLLYGAPAWTILLRHWRDNSDMDLLAPNRQIMYVHSGGMEGVNTQLLRYKYKGLVDLDDIQIPPKDRS